jgi:hypothetical protein
MSVQRLDPVITFKAECSVTYRYTCEKCGFKTDDIKTKLEQLAQHRHKVGKILEVNINLDVKEMDETKQRALDRLKELTVALDSIYNTTSEDYALPEEPMLEEYYNKTFAKAKTCPKCKGSQSWYPVSLSRISKWNHIFAFVLITCLTGFGVERVIDIDNDIFIILQAVLMFVGALTGYIIACLRIRLRKLKRYRVRIHPGPTVIWGQPTVRQMDIPHISEYNKADDTRPIYTERVINTLVQPISVAGSYHMLETDHANLMGIKNIIDYRHGVYGISEEQFEGIPLSALINSGLGLHDFHDYILQLCDALEYMHSQNPPLIHHALTADNILIGKDNLLKLVNFDHVSNDGSPSDDIRKLGELIAGVNKPYIKRFNMIIERCNGTYQSIEELRKDLLPLLRPPYVKIVIVIFIIIFMLIRLRRFL